MLLETLAGKRCCGKRPIVAVAGALLLAVTGCGAEDGTGAGGSGGGGGGGAGGTGGTGGTGGIVVQTFTVGGTVEGLAGTGLVLQLNDRDDLAIEENGAFAFATALDDGTDFQISVAVQPTGLAQVCSVEGGSGRIDGADIEGVTISCVTRSFTIGVTVAGLQGDGLTLQNNGGDDLVIDADGDYAFTGSLLDGSEWAITIAAQPTGIAETCAVATSTGTIEGADVQVEVACAVDTFLVHGTLTGLSGTGLVLQNNGADDLVLDADGPFTFATAIPDQAIYDVRVAQQPQDVFQDCTVADGNGRVRGADVEGISVTCIDTHAVGGTVTGLTGTGLSLRNNGRDDLVIEADGPFTFSGRIKDGWPFDVKVGTQPAGQHCTVANGAGTATADFDAVAITCVDLFTVGGSVAGLTGGGLVLQNNGADTLTISADGMFVFPTPLPAGSAFDVTILTQPPGQLCTIAGASGTLAADYDQVVVACNEQPFTIGGTVTGGGVSGVVLQNNGGDDITVGTGTFTFPTALVDGSTYSITVLSTPDPWLVCTVTNGSGTVNAADVTNVVVACAWLG